jgi:hypothetical protein
VQHQHLASAQALLPESFGRSQHITSQHITAQQSTAQQITTQHHACSSVEINNNTMHLSNSYTDNLVDLCNANATMHNTTPDPACPCSVLAATTANTTPYTNLVAMSVKAFCLRQCVKGRVRLAAL